MAFLTLVQHCSPEEWKVPPTGSLLRFRALVLFHSLEQVKQSEASGGICWQLNNPYESKALCRSGRRP